MNTGRANIVPKVKPIPFRFTNAIKVNIPWAVAASDAIMLNKDFINLFYKII